MSTQIRGAVKRVIENRYWRAREADGLPVHVVHKTAGMRPAAAVTLRTIDGLEIFATPLRWSENVADEDHCQDCIACLERTTPKRRHDHPETVVKTSYL